MKPALPQLSVGKWLIICFALSILGSLIAVVGGAIFDGVDFSNPYFVPATLEQLVVLTGYSLLVNVLGATGLIVAVFIRKRTRRG